MKDMHVGAADADKSDIHCRFARFGLAMCDGFDRKVPASAIKGCVLGHGKGLSGNGKRGEAGPIEGHAGAGGIGCCAVQSVKDKRPRGIAVDGK